MTHFLYSGNDNLITVDLLTDIATNEVINDATVTAQVLDEAGTQVGVDIPMAYVVASQGKYIGVIDDAMALELNSRYTVRIHAEASGGRVADWKLASQTIRRDSK